MRGPARNLAEEPLGHLGYVRRSIDDLAADLDEVLVRLPVHAHPPLQIGLRLGNGCVQVLHQRRARHLYDDVVAEGLRQVDDPVAVALREPGAHLSHVVERGVGEAPQVGYRTRLPRLDAQLGQRGRTGPDRDQPLDQGVEKRRKFLASTFHLTPCPMPDRNSA